MDTITVWLFLSFTLERIVGLLLSVFPRLDKKQVVGVDIPVILALVLALVLSFGAHLNFFEIFAVDFQWPFVGNFLTAFFMVGGSSVVHDILGWVNASKENSRSANGK